MWDLTNLIFSELTEDGTLVPKYVGGGTQYEVCYVIMLYFILISAFCWLKYTLRVTQYMLHTKTSCINKSCQTLKILYLFKILEFYAFYIVMIIHYKFTCKYILFTSRILRLVTHFVDPRC